ncbi:hypothetical protein PIB30_009822 [Stylosanthes scabra]|uniref:Uncharacterized protein n=1 Tax=Stylosanthes scabra TaxID=79078 RepID=A0ABU6Z312_9FABA|nr:hypothetical protein [Stylosanthes scabra]
MLMGLKSLRSVDPSSFRASATQVKLDSFGSVADSKKCRIAILKLSPTISHILLRNLKLYPSGPALYRWLLPTAKKHGVTDGSAVSKVTAKHEAKLVPNGLIFRAKRRHDGLILPTAKPSVITDGYTINDIAVVRSGGVVAFTDG